ncbi:fumarate hydratase FumD [Buttiauxella warmboldiae]|uniref:Fumarase D n=1 Tax=Buttiauxella warmboldiae TaxID=82993 RepID=A0A3N5DZQ5_9ENTR|nr:fumarate hydratase FumD [Buttiauxella warmboldiae]RPH22855.1 fumarate hydratase FumD [Buttiauxella warmboldiae]
MNITDKELYDEMCRVVGKVVLEMRDLGQEPKHVVIAGVVRTMSANGNIQRSPLTSAAMSEVIRALGFAST